MPHDQRVHIAVQDYMRAVALSPENSLSHVRINVRDNVRIYADISVIKPPNRRIFDEIRIFGVNGTALAHARPQERALW